MKRINLTRGQIAIVDDDCFEYLNQFKWLAIKCPLNYYAGRRHMIGIGKVVLTLMHRAIMVPDVGSEIDHINHDGLDNRRRNLRIVNRSQNQMNRKKVRGVTSKYKGVRKRKSDGKWVAYIREEFSRSFDDEVTAAKFYDAEIVKICGEYAYLNFGTHPELAVAPLTEMQKFCMKCGISKEYIDDYISYKCHIPTESSRNNELARLQYAYESPPERSNRVDYKRKHGQYEMIMSAIKRLTFREKSIVRLRFGIDCSVMTLVEIGRKYKITKERVRQIESTALGKLRRVIRRTSF